ncbi:hypothetical protein BRADI_5g11853v3 [Brachypodium distachyon]|uniref:Uncharacterized protein n=1 Tax=Brachypodium distachyon TaxID=15368 RepID=A0A2K2CGP8_BRADI|nr:hypothetical protein BRADI_5g11853v3 [Brachypodium distachyon]
MAGEEALVGHVSAYASHGLRGVGHDVVMTDDARQAEVTQPLVVLLIQHHIAGLAAPPSFPFIFLLLRRASSSHGRLFPRAALARALLSPASRASLPPLRRRRPPPRAPAPLHPPPPRRPELLRPPLSPLPARARPGAAAVDLAAPPTAVRRPSPIRPSRPSPSLPAPPLSPSCSLSLATLLPALRAAVPRRQRLPELPPSASLARPASSSAGLRRPRRCCLPCSPSPCSSSIVLRPSKPEPGPKPASPGQCLFPLFCFLFPGIDA